MPTALITGITGQDGSYLAELLLAKGYRVVGVVRRSSTTPYERIAHLVDRLELVSADLLDQTSLTDAVARHEARRDLQPRGAELRADVVDAARAHRRVHRARRDAHARGDEEGGAEGALLPGQLERDVRQGASRRRSARRRRSIRAARTAWRRCTATGSRVNYRESFGLYAVSGILFNHESPRRGLEFVTRKVTDGAARMQAGHLEGRSSSATSRRGATGASPATTSTRCGGCCSRTSPTTTSIGHGRDVVGAAALRGRLRRRSISTTATSSCTTRSSTGRPRSTCSSATRRRRASELGWEPTVRLPRSSCR